MIFPIWSFTTTSPGLICSPEARRRLGRLDQIARCCKEDPGRRSSGRLPNGFKLFGYNERTPFVSFQRNLLRQHNITCDQSLLRNKTPACCYPSARVHLADIHRHTVTNAVALAALTADNVKIPIRLILRQLFRRQPFLQQIDAAYFCLGVTRFQVPFSKGPCSTSRRPL